MTHLSKRFKSILLSLNLVFFYAILLPIVEANRDVFDGESLDIEFRVAINAGKKDCFYQVAKMDHLLEISFQITDSKLSWLYPLNDNSDMRINFELFDPSNRLIIRKEHSNSDTHVHSVKQEGVYAFCFDNSYSISTKIINLEVYLYSNTDDDRWGNIDADIKFEEEMTKYTDSVESLKTSVNKIRDNLQSISHSQGIRTAIETRDFNVMSSLSRFINFFSVISLIMIPLVAFSQIMLIRSLFERNSQLRHFFKPVPFFNFLDK